MSKRKRIYSNQTQPRLVRETSIVQKYVNFRMQFSCTCSNLLHLTHVVHPQDAYFCFLDTFDEGQIPIKEFFYVMALNRANRLIGIYKVSEGGITGTVVDIRIIAKFLIEVQASSAIICHNHPSGALRASSSDISITKKVKSALKLFDILLQDHIIVTMDGYYSMLVNKDL